MNNFFIIIAGNLTNAFRPRRKKRYIVSCMSISSLIIMDVMVIAACLMGPIEFANVSSEV